MALCTTEDVERLVLRDITADPSPYAEALIADAQAHIEAEIGRTVESASRTETFDGGQQTLFLQWFPVTAVASVVEDGITLTVDDDFKWYRNKVIRVSGDSQIAWRTLKRQSIVVTYTGGYVSPDHDAELEHLGSICAQVVARAFIKGTDLAALPVGASGAIQSVSLEGSDTVTYATGGGGAGSSISGGFRQFVYLEEDELRQLGQYKGLSVA